MHVIHCNYVVILKIRKLIICVLKSVLTLYMVWIQEDTFWRSRFITNIMPFLYVYSSNYNSFQIARNICVLTSKKFCVHIHYMTLVWDVAYFFLYDGHRMTSTIQERGPRALTVTWVSQTIHWLIQCMDSRRKILVVCMHAPCQNVRISVWSA